MAEREKVTTRFQRLIKDPKLLLMPGGFSPLHARMVEAWRTRLQTTGELP